MINRTRVYVSGPYTKVDPVVNTRTAMDIGAKLLALGYAPFIPHLTLFLHLLSPQDWETWLDYDEQWVACCHVLLRLPGESKGADREAALAESLGIPVVHSIPQLRTAAAPLREQVA